MREPARGSEVPYQAVAVLDRGRIHRQQAFEDAIAFRRARLAARCRRCAASGPGEKCDEHARDLQLIAEYRQAINRSSLVLGPAAATRRPLSAGGRLP